MASHGTPPPNNSLSRRRKRARLSSNVRQTSRVKMTTDEFRKMALEIPMAVELLHMNHPDFRVAGKIFASLGVPEEGWGMVKLSPEQQRALVNKAPETFKPCNGAWGRQGCTNVYLPSAKTRFVREALNAAEKNVAHAKKKIG